MRKYFLAFLGILCILLISGFGFTQQQKIDEVSSNFSPCFISGSNYYIWGIEKSETFFQETNDNETKHHKKKIQDHFCRFFKYSNWFYLPITFVLQKTESSINLFLIYHFSFSLWEAFLQ